MEHYAGIDVSLELSSVCVVDATGRVVREGKVVSEPEALIAWFRGLGLEVARVGLEADPLSQWLFAAMRDAGFAVELLETRHDAASQRCGLEPPMAQSDGALPSGGCCGLQPLPFRAAIGRRGHGRAGP